ncbi:hypothetical protein LZC95_11245 [Pendulispora brunnea]|uniref:Uncharacterized protein n=1 Tax=Pendulispora brunnea TaxID=2905690 RepID=A0ABZ2KFD8_9BACT
MDIPFAIPVLRVLFDFARDRSPADVGQLLLCVAEHLRVRGRAGEGWPAAFRPTLRALERAELVEISPDGRIRLTASGFAMAVACFSASLKPVRERPSQPSRSAPSRHVRPRLVA